MLRWLYLSVEILLGIKLELPLALVLFVLEKQRLGVNLAERSMA